MRSRIFLGLWLWALLGCAERPLPTSGTPSTAEPSVTPSTPLSASATVPKPPPDPATHAAELAQRFIIIDGHIDVPWRLWEGRDKKGNVTENVSERTAKGDFDYPRAKEGGLDAPFMSIYVPAKFEAGGAKKMANQLIDIVENIAKGAPDKFVLARSTADVKKNAKDGKISLLLGMENGSPVEKKLENVQFFYDRGIRYITLAHSKDNHLADSSYDQHHSAKGLTPFGEKVVGEMNRLGILVDVSHVSDDAFWDVMKVTKVPVIASHSSCRHFTPDWPRNMSDEMIRALGKNGGVIQINFGSAFIDGTIQKEESSRWKQRAALLEKNKLESDDPRAKPLLEQFEKEHKARFASVEQVADHIEHVIGLVGVDHVGFGSDFDGVGDSLPTGLKDVSMYKNLIRVLIERGKSDAEIEKICSGNVLRVWEKVEAFAGAQKSP